MLALVRRGRARRLLLATLAMVGACAPLAKVSETKPSLGTPYGTTPELRCAEQAIAEGHKLESSDPNKAIGVYLSGVEAALTELQRDPNGRLATFFAIPAAFFFWKE